MKKWERWITSGYVYIGYAVIRYITEKKYQNPELALPVHARQVFYSGSDYFLFLYAATGQNTHCLLTVGFNPLPDTDIKTFILAFNRACFLPHHFDFPLVSFGTVSQPDKKLLTDPEINYLCTRQWGISLHSCILSVCLYHLY